MKCIKNKTTGEIRRVKTEVADQMEKMGWGYVPKSEWKAVTRVETTKVVVEKVVNEEGKVRRNREKKNKK
jgi:hypothetical protein